jgi:uncharacterized protein (TIGR03089 family)
MWNEVSRSLNNIGPAPVITWLSPAGRIELSGRTFLNAISKAANYLVDGCGFDDESTIRVELENHWQAPVWKLAALVAGVGLSDDSKNIFCFSDSDLVGNKFVVSRDPFGMPAKDLPAGLENVSLEVRSHGDYFAPTYSLGDPAVQMAGRSISEAELMDLVSSEVVGRQIKGPYALAPCENSLDALVLQALVPALTGNSVVLLDGVDSDSLVVAAEKVTKILSN